MDTGGGRPREYTYHLDTSGTLTLEGDPIVHERVLAQFFRNLRVLPDGRYLSICGGEHNYLEVDDTPFVVTGVRLTRAPDGGLERVDLVLNDHAIEPLDLGTVSVGANDVVYCRVRDGRFPARLARAPQLSLLQCAEERRGRVVLSVGDETIVLA